MLALLAPQWSRGQVVADSCLDEVTTVGMRRDKSLTTAAPTFRLDSASLRRMGITDITGALRHVAGIHLRDYGGAGGLKTVNVQTKPFTEIRKKSTKLLKTRATLKRLKLLLKRKLRHRKKAEILL